jgi:hypothetical protein
MRKSKFNLRTLKHIKINFMILETIPTTIKEAKTPNSNFKLELIMEEKSILLQKGINLAPVCNHASKRQITHEYVKA